MQSNNLGTFAMAELDGRRPESERNAGIRNADVVFARNLDDPTVVSCVHGWPLLQRVRRALHRGSGQCSRPCRIGHAGCQQQLPDSAGRHRLSIGVFTGSLPSCGEPRHFFLAKIPDIHRQLTRGFTCGAGHA